MPKRPGLTECSGRVDPKLCSCLMDRWHRALHGLGTDPGGDGFIDLDFHTIPWHGKDAEAPVERHCVSRRSRRQKGVPAFLARDAGSRLTTYANPGRINAEGIDFLTLRRRSGSRPAAVAARPDSEWKQVRLNNVGRIHRTPQVPDQRVRITGYREGIRQLAARGLGHERPTLPLTNQMKTSASQPVDRHARRMVIENAIDFLHMDALSAAVPMKVDLDLQLTLMASGLHRLLAVRLGNGRRNAKSRTLFRNFVRAPADITVTGDCVDVRLGRRANNPFLLNASHDGTDIAVRWPGKRWLRISFL